MDYHTRGVDDSGEGAVEADSDFHVVVLALGCNALHPRHVQPLVGRLFLLPPIGRLAISCGRPQGLIREIANLFRSGEGERREQLLLATCPLCRTDPR